MIFFYAPRSVPCSAAMKEASSGNRWEQTQRTTGRHYVESDSKLGVSFRDLPSGNSAEEEIEIQLESDGMEDTKKTFPNESTKQGVYGFIETKGTSTVPAGGLTKSFWAHVVAFSSVFFFWDTSPWGCM